ncbi:3'-5' exonuclease [Corynebacterium flavescens]|uniref:DNA polymerase III subunit epsilon n=1 Tax=Corynebacterium flavescens TaxID=28028 RepID=A0A1L7CLJ4_CORFL|nr:exonuclease domain-containing protein [Corynebacterium flavescens]APT86683.1 DNA polymerase III subunit epsilon [Corynebacterium flavescens]KAA8722848.1 DNA polymerase III subunit epsilon [Corynebacterium flavescens]MDN6198388.1 DNA polymerase III subunit epsilon [Corynebacterium flavescens]MDN6225492.1 DNA polymerase III subunit epsilon [Corynebacterium flavescens]MDN6236602.1 DNA polymerase III subunit epsilon [Corynebacterium flavescens]
MGIFDRFRDRLDLQAPAPSTSVAELDLLAVDMETTGVRPGKDRLLSIGWVPVTGGRIILAQAGYVLIKGSQVGDSATIHGLTDQALEAGVDYDEAIARLLDALRGRALLAHFAALEVGFLSAATTRLHGVQPRLRVVDTFALERRHMERMGTYPRGEDLRLPRVRERYGLPRYAAHNALSDALACAELYLALSADRGSDTLGDLTRVTQINNN